MWSVQKDRKNWTDDDGNAVRPTSDTESTDFDHKSAMCDLVEKMFEKLKTGYLLHSSYHIYFTCSVGNPAEI